MFCYISFEARNQHLKGRVLEDSGFLDSLAFRIQFVMQHSEPKFKTQSFKYHVCYPEDLIVLKKYRQINDNT